MNNKQKILSTLAAVILVLTPVAPAYAASSTHAPGNFFQGLIQFIAQKFGLDQNQVQSAVQTYQTQHKQQMQTTMQDREKAQLDKLVSEGKITASQEQQILEEKAKLQSEYPLSSLKGLTPDQRKTQLQKEQAEIQAWSQSTGISANYLRMGFGMGFGRGWGRHQWGGGQPTATPTP